MRPNARSPSRSWLLTQPSGGWRCVTTALPTNSTVAAASSGSFKEEGSKVCQNFEPRVAMKMCLLIAVVALFLTACGGAWAILQGERRPGEVAAPPEVQTPIERTQDDFTLGMTQDEALARFAAGLQQHTLTVLSRTGLVLDRPEALRE